MTAISPEEAGKLIVTGLTFGCIHVLTGADHLSALATLSVGSRWKAFGLGIRWGLGHSTGLILVAAILLGLGDRIDPKVLEHACSWIVGVFMILLGAWGILKARKHEMVRQKAVAAAAAVATSNELEGEGGKRGGDDTLQQQEEGRGGRARIGVAEAAEISPLQSVSDPRSTAADTADSASTPSSSSSSFADEDEEMGVELMPPHHFNSSAGKSGSGSGEYSSEGDDNKDGKEEGKKEKQEEKRRRESNDSSSYGINDRHSNDKNTSRSKQSLSSSCAITNTSSTTGISSSPPQHRRGIAEATEPFLERECNEGYHVFLVRLRQCLRVDLESHAVQRIVAFSVGIVHGIAGPGGVLGVLPAARLHSWPKASLYLATFCLSSTLIMGIFAALYGECTSRLGSARNIEYKLELFSASLSIIVGVLWMAMILAGKLDVVFG